ncbi:MAG: hypothetical protein R3C01_16170 [Planctomycetaceae bacterium]
MASLLLSTGWENKLSLLLVLVFAASLLGLADLPALTHGLAAARYGLLFLLGLWLVHGLFQLRPASPIGGDIILPQETIVSLPTEETPTPVASTPEAATAAPSDGIASEAKPTSPDEPPPDKS